MDVHEWNDACCLNDAVDLALGTFDAMHWGHQKLLKPRLDRPLWVLYFRRSPAMYKKSELGTKMLRSEQQRLDILARLGVNGALCVDFSTKFSKMKAERFLAELTQRLTIDTLVVGEDFLFGNDRKTVLDLKRMAGVHKIKVEVHSFLTDDYGEKWSSSRLCEAVTMGDFAQVMLATGKPYALDLRFLPRQKNDTHYVYNLEPSDQVLPPVGEYLLTDGKKVVMASLYKLVSEDPLDQAIFNHT